MSKFILLSTQRSGTTWLIDALNHVEGITAYGEMLLERSREWDAGSLSYPGYVDTKEGRDGGTRNLFRYLDGLYATGPVVGFKLMYSQIRLNPSILPYLLRRRVQVLHMIRRNYLDTALSQLQLRARGQAHAQSQQERPETLKLTIPPEELLDEIRRIEKKIQFMQRTARLSGLPVLEVSYEALRQDAGQFHNIVAFLGLEANGIAMESRLVKIRGKGYEEAIQNYAEVSDALLKSPYASLLTDPLLTQS